MTADDLDGVADTVARSLLARAGIAADQWVDAMRRRWGWGYRPETLDSVGERLGLTRERVRQVAKKAAAERPLPAAPVPPALVSAIELVDWDEPGDVSELLIDGLAAGPHSYWSQEGVLDVLAALGRGDLVAPLRDRMEVGRQRSTPSKGLRQAIKQARFKSGLLDVRTVRLDGVVVPPDLVAAAARAMFPRAAQAGPWVLCGGKKLTTVESSAIIQLQVAERALSGPELLTGVYRALRKRGYECAPASETLRLLEDTGHFVRTDQGYELDEDAPTVPIVGNDLWLLDLLEGEPDRAMPIDAVMRRARTEGVNQSSISVHLSFTTFVRKQRGLAYIVGSAPDPDRAEVLRRANRALKVPTSIAYAVTPNGLQLEVTLGTTALVTGVLGVNRELQGIIADQEPNVSCCEATQFDVHLRLDGTNWYNWASLFVHLMRAHGVDEGDTVRFLMMDDLIQCREPWAQPAEPLTAADAMPEISSPTDIPFCGTVPALMDSHLADVVRPGDPWLEPRGTRMLVLSVKAGALVVPRTRSRVTTHARSRQTAAGSVSLNDRYGAEARRLAGEMLAIRPSGGRVWVDEAGNATTLIDGELTYLGRLPAEWSW